MSVNKRRLIPLHVVIGIVLILGLVQAAEKPTLGIDRPLDAIELHALQDASDPDVAEFLLDHFAAGAIVDVRFADMMVPERVLLQPYYDRLDIAIMTVVAFTYFILAIFVIDRRPNDRAAHAFYALSMSAGILVATTDGYLNAFNLLLGYGIKAVFMSMYAVLPAALFRFTTVFPVRLGRRAARRSSVIGSISIAVVAAIVIVHGMLFGQLVWKGTWSPDTLSWLSIIHGVTRIWLAVGVLLSVAMMIRTYRRSTSLEIRQRSLWLLTGVIISAVGFIALWVLPVSLGYGPLLPESIVVLLAVIAPIAFAIAIVRYRALDITVIANLSVVHAMVIAVAVAFYVAAWTLLVDRFDLKHSFVLVIMAIVILDLLLFSRSIGIVKRFVDRLFFRVQYDYRSAQAEAAERIASAPSTTSIASTIVDLLRSSVAPRASKIVIEDPATRSMVTQTDGTLESTSLHVKVQDGDGHSYGFIAVGPKRSGLAYTDLDRDLVSAIARQVVNRLQAVEMEHAVERSTQEQARLEELNRAKSLFVSSVSHDLKTPLTSIRLYAEMMAGDTDNEKHQRFLKIIEGESERLARLIDQVLTFSRIERGVMEYRPSTTNLNAAIEDVLEIMSYQFHMVKAEVTSELRAAVPDVTVDADALKNALMNLLSNAVKYANGTPWIRVSTLVQGTIVEIRVEDHGIGIAQEHIVRLHEPYMRVDQTGSTGVAGTGIGLATVRHFLDGHNGQLHIESVEGEGTTVTMTLPIARSDTPSRGS